MVLGNVSKDRESYGAENSKCCRIVTFDEVLQFAANVYENERPIGLYVETKGVEYRKLQTFSCLSWRICSASAHLQELYAARHIMACPCLNREEGTSWVVADACCIGADDRIGLGLEEKLVRSIANSGVLSLLPASILVHMQIACWAAQLLKCMVLAAGVLRSSSDDAGLANYSDTAIILQSFEPLVSPTIQVSMTSFKTVNLACSFFA